MTRIYLLLPLLWLSTQIAGTAAVSDCDPISICSDFRSVRIAERTAASTIPDFKNESEIGKQRHWEGVVPQHYEIQLNFFNRTHYNGSVDIKFKVVQATSRIMINHHVDNPGVDYTRISIKPRCAAASKRSNDSAGPCIEKATFSESERTLVLDLKRGNLKAGSIYTISFDSFRGEAQDLYATKGAIGLREATVRGAGRTGNYSAVTTIFQMRYARSVFPCFDHPALKASFELCLEHPADISAASNTEPLPSASGSVGADRKRQCFEPTPVIPTYVFTFSLMENYTSESVQIPDGPKIEIYAPSSNIDGLIWMLNESIPVVQYMERITKFKFPLKRLAFVAQFPAPFWGVENFGLVTVDGTHTEGKGELAYTILYHEIVHQWLGNVVTIEDWREICLQEGLTAYFEWKITADRRRGDLRKKADRERLSNDGGRYDPYALKDYAVTQDIANHCFGRPPFFFHTIAQKEGFETVEKFLAKLIEKRKYATADIDLWDDTLAEVSKSGAQLKGYIKGWFLQPGPLYLITTKVQGSDCVLIRQNLSDAGAGVPRPVPLNVSTFGQSPKTIATILKNLENRVCGIGGADIFLVDPESHTFTRKAYTADNYRRLLRLQKQSSTTLTADQFKNVVGDFCKAFIDNVLPLADEPATTAPSDWLEVFELIRNSTVQLSRSCKICTNTKEENERVKWGQQQWNQWCADLRLNQAIGRNYTFTRHKL